MTFTTKPSAPSLVLLALEIALSQLAAFAVKHDASELMAAIAAIELNQDATAIGFIMDEPEQVEGLDEPTQLLQQGPAWTLQGYKSAAGSDSSRRKANSRCSFPEWLQVPGRWICEA